MKLTQGKKISPFLSDVLIGMFSPDSRIYSLLDLERWDHRREYYRILSEKDCALN